MYPVWDREAAQLLSNLAHHGQPDKAGRPYFHHPMVVAGLVEREARRRGWLNIKVDLAVQVALLHDVLEDTKFTAGMLQALGAPAEVVWRVSTLTKVKGQSLRTYCRLVRRDDVTLLVKDMDVEHNSDPNRLALVEDESERERLTEKYERTHHLLHEEV